MENVELESVFNTYGALFSEETQYTIDFVKDNRQTLISNPKFGHLEDFKKYLAIIGRYIESLARLQQYEVLVNEVNNFLPLIEQARILFKVKQMDNKWYLTILFQKALASFNLKDYHTAYQEFKVLKALDPNSPELKKWFFYAKYAKRKFYFSLTLWISAIFIFVPMFFGKYFSMRAHILLSSVGVVLALNNLWFHCSFKKNTVGQAVAQRYL